MMPREITFQLSFRWVVTLDATIR